MEFKEEGGGGTGDLVGVGGRGEVQGGRRGVTGDLVGAGGRGGVQGGIEEEEQVICLMSEVELELQGVTRKKRTATDLLVLTRLFGT